MAANLRLEVKFFFKFEFRSLFLFCKKYVLLITWIVVKWLPDVVLEVNFNIRGMFNVIWLCIQIGRWCTCSRACEPRNYLF